MLTLRWSDGNSFIPVIHSLISAAEVKNLLCGGKQHLGITTNYILFDSWFSVPKTILELKNQEQLDTIAMMKKQDYVQIPG